MKLIKQHQADFNNLVKYFHSLYSYFPPFLHCNSSLIWNGLCRDFPGSPVVKTLPSNRGGVVWSLVWELRSHMPHGQKIKISSRSSIVTNSIKTLKKMVHIYKKIFKKILINNTTWLLFKFSKTQKHKR